MKEASDVFLGHVKYLGRSQSYAEGEAVSKRSFSFIFCAKISFESASQTEQEGLGQPKAGYSASLEKQSKLRRLKA